MTAEPGYAGPHNRSGQAGKRVTVVLADDQRLIRSGLKLIIATEPDLDVIAEAADGVEAVEVAGRLQPDVVLMDIRMPRLNGIEATAHLQRLRRPPRVLILTTFDDDRYVYDALRAGASGFLLKDAPERQLLSAIRTVVDGVSLLTPEITRRLVEHFTPPPVSGPLPTTLAQLTARELDVLKYLARGGSNAAIAADLYLSEATVKTHVARVLSKLGLTSRTQAVILAYETGLVTPRQTHDGDTA